MKTHFTNIAEMGADPGFIKSWTTNPAIVSVLLEAEARHLDRQKKQAACQQPEDQTSTAA